MDLEKLENTFRALDRKEFIGPSLRGMASINAPLPIGYGQTISQPTLVLEMTALLDPEPEHRVLEIGTGSGYQTALLSPFCATVYTIERIEPLLKQAQVRLERLGYENIEYRLGDGNLGWTEEAPFDRILVAAAASKIPPALLEQLGTPGRLIMPVGEREHQDLLLIVKDKNGKLTQQIVTQVAFVELVGPYGWENNKI